ncbi:MAG: hypothetical protein N3F66_09595 [Spirochaetes bacterium]|nr:hypothetical protein [Spirochaetota bacterium]
MNIETTTCISLEHLELLKFYARTYNMSLRTFISTMISFAAQWEKVSVKSFKQISYRKKGSSWKRLHLVLYEDEYEFFMDVKKVWKMSLAKIIAFCLDNVLDEFLKILDVIGDDDYTDNYRYTGYTFSVFREEGIVCCQFYWGPHPEIIKKAKILGHL